jgi:hypothetical protein
MAKRLFSVSTFTPTAQADGVLAAGTFAAMVPGAATDLLQIMEVAQSGQASASSVNSMTLARSSTLGITPTALALPNADGFMRSASSALTTLPSNYVAAATAPNRSPAVTIARMRLGFNSFGGIYRWTAAPGEEWTALGNATTSQSESVFSSDNVGTAGAQSLQVVYEML